MRAPQRASPIEQLYAVRAARAEIAAHAFYVKKCYDRRSGTVSFVPRIELPSEDASFRERCSDAALLEPTRDITDGMFRSTGAHVAYLVVPCAASLALFPLIGPVCVLGVVLGPVFGAMALADHPAWSRANASHVEWAERLLGAAERAVAELA